ncbi:hypothetical protein SOVF_200530 [Spinacia oleracea]|nr:hypothetical protein SOVF_200530 [Spinacia oleracea]
MAGSSSRMGNLLMFQESLMTKHEEMQSACNSSRMIEDANSTGVAILSKFSEQRESMKDCTTQVT